MISTSVKDYDILYIFLLVLLVRLNAKALSLCRRFLLDSDAVQEEEEEEEDSEGAGLWREN